MKDIIFSKVLKIIKSWKKTFFDFSQLGEEKIIDNLLERISQKYNIEKSYVDIGGFNPIKFSNTYKLYQKGWTGIVVEPNPVKTKNWKIIRPKDFVINAALVPESYNKKEIELFKNNENDPTESPIKKNYNSKSYISKIIKISDIELVCQKKNLSPFFLNIDIEGFEDKIILDLKNIKHLFPLICVEILINKKDDYSIFNYKNFECVKYLENKGYYLVSVCGVSLIFCHKTFWIPYNR